MNSIRLFALLLLLVSCTPVIRPPGKVIGSARLTRTDFITRDGARLPYHSWLPKNSQKPVALIIALHGFNDYSRFFTKPGQYLARLGIGSYAYDQRGFGQAPHRGFWPGIDTFRADLTQFTQLIAQLHPGTPIYLLGESMGGAVVMITASSAHPPPANGLILAAPAIWGRESMPWYQRWLLWLTLHTIPGMELTGEGLEITPSDNIEMLQQLGRDPLIIKETRIDTIGGLVDLMDLALLRTAMIKRPTLILYGDKDQIIPKAPTYLMLRRMQFGKTESPEVALYQDGYHMLLRDLQAARVWRDIAAWIADPQSPLPSGADQFAAKRLTEDGDHSAGKPKPD